MQAYVNMRPEELCDLQPSSSGAPHYEEDTLNGVEMSKIFPFHYATFPASGSQLTAVNLVSKIDMFAAKPMEIFFRKLEITGN